ncbi:hypothetical protein [Bdellovibrio svalbardensis]|uniref:Uncharacterized protein n=1 Tax=Bdellovibrio svalbardensis TaxID=2972972 RepID=A0ABT6DGY6_9BACT|nr:hypothetical protein [Bdellovibrio svalbardensis]MDG0816072.1 hypothetical protein [Bdellovibrio svalbardensis]
MTKSKCLLLVAAALFVVGTAEAQPRKANLKMRQTQKVSSVTRVGKPAHGAPVKPNVTNTLRSASVLAESLDNKAGRIIDAMSLSPIKKWLHNVDEGALKAQYAEELMVHMTRMTSLFSAHRKAGPFAKFNEFEFQNLLVKSDYLLSLAVSRQSLEFAHHQEIFAEKFNTTLAAYNAERVGFDQKMIRFSFVAKR